ncbi:MAG: zf-HC2 domain-containing protein [Clostridia bacterium]|nr:zf-HC2 domain-containing protein [Clostridia bacterium]
MKKECEIIRDILPLYVDDACSASSREIVDEHLKDCPDCAAYLEQIRDSEVEGELKEERALVIKNQARRFKRRSAAAGSVVSALFMIPILVCLIVNLTSGRTLDWFYVVAAGMLVAASLTVVPIMMPESKLFWTFCAFCISLVILLAVCCLYSHGNWFFVAASASLFGLSVVFLPFAIKARPLRPWVEGHNKALLVLAVDGILFGNMMNVISLHQKGFGFTMLMAVLVAAALVLLIANVRMKGRNGNE